MKQAEFTKKARAENLTDLYIRYDNGFCDRSYVLGCTQIEDLWYIYETDDKGNKVVRLICDDEDKTFDRFYHFVLRRRDRGANSLAV